MFGTYLERIRNSVNSCSCQMRPAHFLVSSLCTGCLMRPHVLSFEPLFSPCSPYPWVYHRDAKPTVEQGAGFLFQKLVMLDKFLKLILSALQSIKFNKHTSLQGQVQFWMTVPFILLVKVFMVSLWWRAAFHVSHTSQCVQHMSYFFQAAFSEKYG